MNRMVEELVMAHGFPCNWCSNIHERSEYVGRVD